MPSRGFFMSDPFVSIIMRSFNEGWALRETLPALQAQDYRPWELIVIDSGSTDGSVDLIRPGPAPSLRPNPARRIQSQPRHESRHAAGASRLRHFPECRRHPAGPHWLRPLAEALQDPKTAAVFGRQIPRPDCRAVYAHDYERCFGPSRESARWEHFFSMVSSGLRKDIWAKRGFLEKMQYSEDDEYTRWCRAQGYRVVYCPESVVMHSHNYTPGAGLQTQFRRGQSPGRGLDGLPHYINWPLTFVLGWARIVSGTSLLLAPWAADGMPHAVRIRWEQRRARLAGFRDGWVHYGRSEPPGSPQPATASSGPCAQG